jgi:hypothetical protein
MVSVLDTTSMVKIIDTIPISEMDGLPDGMHKPPMPRNRLQFLKISSATPIDEREANRFTMTCSQPTKPAFNHHGQSFTSRTVEYPSHGTDADRDNFTLYFISTFCFQKLPVG